MKRIDETPFSRESTLSDRVKEKFGRAPSVIVRAVRDWLAKEPGALDHHHLEVIAAAAPAIGDPQQVALLINEMPVTQMQIATDDFDKEEVTASFEAVIGRYPPAVRKRLVGDLIHESALTPVCWVPPDRRTQAARALLDENMLKHSKGSIINMANAAGARGIANERSITFVLDELERRIDKAERGSESRGPGKMPFGSVGDVVLAVLNTANEAATADQVKRAWQLMRRCDNSNDTWRAWTVQTAIKRPELLEAFSDEILDEIDQLGSPEIQPLIVKKLRGLMVKEFACPEREAARAILDGALCDNGPLPILRFLAYSTRSAESQFEYLPPMTLEDVEMRLARSGRPESRDPAFIPRIKSPEALKVISEGLFDYELSADVLRAFADHPSARIEDVQALAERYGAGLSEEERSSLRIEVVLRHPMVDVGLASSCLKSIPEEDLEEWLDFAVVNAASSCHQELIDYLVGHLTPSALVGATEAERSSALAHLTTLAEVAVSDSTHQTLTHVATRLNDVGLARAVFRNGMLSIVLADQIRKTFTLDDSWWPQVVTKAYGPQDVVDRVIENDLLVDGNTIRPSVLQVMLKECHGGPDAKLSSDERRLVVDALDTLADRIPLAPDIWRYISSNPDVHVRYRFASHPKAPIEGNAFSTYAPWLLELTAEAARQGVGKWPGPRMSLKWSDLPNDSDNPLPRSDAVELIDGTEIAGRTLHTPLTRRELRATADEMGNCVESFVELIRRGKAVVAWTTYEHDKIAAVWTVDNDEKLNLYEVNAKFNTNAVPDAVRTGIDDLTNEVNRMIELGVTSTRIEPDAEVSSGVVVVELGEQDDVDLDTEQEHDSRSNSATREKVVRVQRGPAIVLDAATSEDGKHLSADRVAAPSALGSSMIDDADNAVVEEVTTDLPDVDISGVDSTRVISLE